MDAAGDAHAQYTYMVARAIELYAAAANQCWSKK